MSDYQKRIIRKGKDKYAAMKNSMKDIYSAIFPGSTPQELKLFASTLNNPHSIHTSVDYFEKTVMGRSSNTMALSSRIQKLKKKLKIADTDK